MRTSLLPQQLPSCSDVCRNVKDWYWQQPFFSRNMLLLLWLLHILSHWPFYAVPSTLMCAPYYFSDISVKALLFAPLFHADVFHILFNSIATFQLLKPLEFCLGTSGVALFTFLTLVVQSFLAIVLSTAWHLLMVYGPQSGTIHVAHSCALGFSGVLFALLTFEAYDETLRSGQGAYSFFGLFSMPRRFFPWFLLVATALVLPGTSFVAHFAGILTGLLLWRWPTCHRFCSSADKYVPPLLRTANGCTRPNSSEDDLLPLPAAQASSVGGYARDDEQERMGIPAIPSLQNPGDFKAFAGTGRTLGSATSPSKPAKGGQPV